MKLDFWIQQRLNVLMIGEHGVGKTSIIKDAFERNGLKWKYFSASTMDPWVDFIGIPKEQKDEQGQPYLELVRPKDFRDDEVEALFFDEYNRAPKKVKNAVMELIQFKSINGRRFDNLRMVWAAINPDDSVDMEYDVEKLDPAQRDRFQIHVEIPFAPNKAFFISKFGAKIANSAIEWWGKQSETSRRQVSPRRLDYALQVWRANGDMRDVLPASVNVSMLLMMLGGDRDFHNQIDQVVFTKDMEKAKDLVKNYLDDIVPIVTSKMAYTRFFVPLFPPEVVRKLEHESTRVRRFTGTKAGTRFECLICIHTKSKTYISKKRAEAHVAKKHPGKTFSAIMNIVGPTRTI